MTKMLPLVTLFAALLTVTSGCVVHTYDDRDDVVYVPSNYAPEVIDAEVGVYWDAALRDDIWYFDVAVDDPDHVSDVISVWADVYDDYSSAGPIESLELFPTNDPYIWYADYRGSSLRLDPFYPNYSVDLYAYDSFEAYDYLTVWAETY